MRWGVNVFFIQAWGKKINPYHKNQHASREFQEIHPGNFACGFARRDDFLATCSANVRITLYNIK